MKKPHASFQDFVDTLDHIEVCRITIAPDGKFCVPSEKDGRITQITPKTRAALAQFMTRFAVSLRSDRSPAKRKTKKKRG